MKFSFLLSLAFLFSTLFAAEEEIKIQESASQEMFEEEGLSAKITMPTEALAIDNTEIAAADNLGPTSLGYPADVDFGPDEEDMIDPHVLRDFIESRGLIRARKCDGCLTIAGDVRARWQEQAESVNGKKVRGSGSKTALNLFKSEVNIFFDYTAKRSWVTTKLKWSNFDGKDGGTMTRVDIDRAWLGYDVYCNEDLDFYIECGRTRADYLFDSKLEFASVYDGLHFYLTDYYKDIGTFVLHGGPFIVDSFTNHYAWIVETGFLGIGGTGFSVKYSYVDWLKHGTTLNYGNQIDSGKKPRKNNPRYRFRVSQILLGYECKPDWLWCKILDIYGAALINTAARPVRSTAYRKLNRAWYVGFTLGRLCKACDWSLEFNYQSVQALALPEFDLSGIGHGNAQNSLISDAILANLGAKSTHGFTNYKGFYIQGLYAFTDSLSIKAVFQRATPRNQTVGGKFEYKSFEFAAIYAF